ncbi:MAG: hypothetical protein ACW99Q_24155, partial [Candidatus Kariarchaeaceae archaeon]
MIQIVSLAIILNENNLFPINEDSEIPETIDGSNNLIIDDENNEIINSINTQIDNEKESNTKINSAEMSANLEKETELMKNPSFSQLPIYNESGINNQIKANESFLVTNDIADINTTGDFSDPSLKDTTTISFPNSGYTNDSQTFTVDNITASYNYEHIEYESSSSSLTSDDFGTQAVGTEFNVTDTQVNVTRIRINYLRTGSPTGQAYISGISGGVPNGTIYGDPIEIGSNSGTNTTLSFPYPVTLSQGTYVIVLNETSAMDPDNYFTWRFVRDDAVGDNDDETQMYRYVWLSSWTAFGIGDLFFSYEYIKLNDTDSSQLKNYNTTPEEINLQYNGTSITSFTDNNLLLDGSTAEFTSNTSAIFDLSYIIEYNSNNNPINLSTSFLVNNGTVPSWNNTFTHDEIPTGAYSVSQRNITIFNLLTDWNSTNVYQNNSLFTDSPDSNSSLSYINGTSSLIIHLDQQLDSFEWLIQFISPNYIQSLDLLQNGAQLLSPNYQINSSDTLTINANMDSSVSGFNGSLLIYDLNDILNHSQLDESINGGTNSLNFTSWDLSSLNQNENINGSYNIVVQWMDSTQTKLGYFGVNLDIIIQTIFSGSTDNSEYVTGETILLTGNFSSFFNGTVLDSVNMTYIVGWNSSVGLLTQSGSHSEYSTSIATFSALAGFTNITVIASLFGHVNRSIVVPFRMIRNTTLDYLANNTISSSLTTYYEDKISLTIYYNDTIGAVSSSTVTVNGSLTLEDVGNSTYTYTFDSSTISYSSSFVLNITASRTDYVSRELLITFNLEET